ncbi:MAG: methyl-accepting chemotaxis protein [Clostridium butyricum]|nr:methyl-accepting chemotaxis protein [Clostridium butyricum]
MKVSVKFKLMMTFFILIVIPMIILGSLSYKMASNSLQKTIKEELKKQTEDTSQLIDKSIESVKGSIEIASLNGQLGTMIQNQNAEEIDTAFNYITDVKKSNEEFMEVLIITDSTGKVIIDTDTKEPDIDLSDRDYMKKTLSTGEIAVSEVLTSRFTGNPAIFISYPINENGKIVGTVVGSIKFDSISKYAANIKIGEKGYAYMISKDGLIVYHPDESKILKDNISDTTDNSFKVIVEEMKAGKTAEGFYTYDGIYKYVTFQPADNWIVAITAEYNEYMASAISIRTNTIIIVIVSIVIAMIWAYIYSTKYIVNPIKKMESLMGMAGDGNLTINSDIKTKDEFGELGKSFNDMINHQEGIVKSVSVASEQLNEASEQMAASLEELSATTEELSATITTVAEDTDNQNKSIINISEVLVQLSSLVQLAENRAKSTSSNAISSKKVADFGRQKVEETVKAMNGINKESNETFKVLESVNNLSVKVGGIVTTINSIAEQTDLLALNAAIEAARAGEHGKGFSVVAEEVRKLAEESNEKAKEISLLINEMIKQTQNAVSAMERANVEVENGVEIVAETDKAFIDIINSINNIVEHVNEILDITSDEVASSDRVVELINEVATVTENNANSCKNVSEAIQDSTTTINNLTATAEETSAMSEQLLKEVEKFEI